MHKTEKKRERERERERNVYVCMVCNRSMRNTSLVVTEYSYMCVFIDREMERGGVVVV